MTLAILCSGQGAQNADMFALTGNAPECTALFAHATKLLGHDPREWIRSASAKETHENRNAQLLCTLQSLSAAAVLADALPSRRCVAGYSVGEVAAWSVAGLIRPDDVLELIVSRADAMNAARKGEQGMLFVRGLNRTAVERLVALGDAGIAIINPGDAYVLAGKQSVLQTIAADAKRQGATRVAAVSVDVASHTSFMADASDAFRKRLATIPTQALPSGVRLFSGIDGAAVLSITEGTEKLARQISQPINWEACLQGCVEAGATAFLELGPGRALADMASGAYPTIAARSFDEFKSIEGVRAWLAR